MVEGHNTDDAQPFKSAHNSSHSGVPQCRTLQEGPGGASDRKVALRRSDGCRGSKCIQMLTLYSDSCDWLVTRVTSVTLNDFRLTLWVGGGGGGGGGVSVAPTCWCPAHTHALTKSHTHAHAMALVQHNSDCFVRRRRNASATYRLFKLGLRSGTRSPYNSRKYTDERRLTIMAQAVNRTRSSGSPKPDL